jgi:hypothetical protein
MIKAIIVTCAILAGHCEIISKREVSISINACNMPPVVIEENGDRHRVIVKCEARASGEPLR